MLYSMVTGLIEMTDLPLKTVFFGNNYEVLECLSSVSDVVAVFTRPDIGSNKSVNSIKFLSDSLNIPVFQPMKKELCGYSGDLREEDLDLIIVCGYKYIIPKEIFSLPQYGTINIHPSLLPRYRGQHVINWAIINGETETGVTLHYIDETLDTGDIIVQKVIPIYFEDTAKELHDRVYVESCKLLKQLIVYLKEGKALRRKGQNSSNASFFKPRKPEDGHIDWNKSSVEIYNLIRALSKPWPGAFNYLKGHKVVFWKAFPEQGPKDASCGKVIKVDGDYISVSTTDGQIIITDYEIIGDDNSNKAITLKTGDFFT